MGRPKKIKEEKEFEVSLVMGNNISDKTYKASGNSILECLDQIKPETVKTRGVLIAKKGVLMSKVILRPVAIKRMVAQVVMRQILEKRLSAYFR